MNGKECPNCLWIGQPELRRELDKIDERMAFYNTVEICPECGSEELYDVALCIDCMSEGVERLATHDDYCSSCAAVNFDGDDIEVFRREAAC